MPTIAIVGAGDGLGRSLAHVFAKRGYKVALIARNPDKLARIVGELTASGHSASGFPADVRDAGTLTAALRSAEAQFGQIDVLEFSPYAGLERVQPEEVTAENLLPMIQTILLGAVTAVNAVLPGMLERQHGTIIFTTGGGAITPYPMLASTNAAQAALRNWAHNLHSTIIERGVYVATVAINVFIGATAPEGVPHRDPDDIAETYWSLHNSRDRIEELVTSHPDGQ